MRSTYCSYSCSATALDTEACFVPVPVLLATFLPDELAEVAELEEEPEVVEERNDRDRFLFLTAWRWKALETKGLRMRC